MRTLLRRAVGVLFRSRAFAGLLSMAERARDPRGGLLRVVTYHRIDEPDRRPELFPGLISATPDVFETQIRALTAAYRPIKLEELLAVARGRARLEPKSVLVTFDDAYEDFAIHAWPILERLGVPATLFVPTAYPDRPNNEFWWDALHRALSSIEAPTLETPIGELAVASPSEKAEAYESLTRHLNAIDHESAMAWVEELVSASVGKWSGEPTVLGWDALRSLATRGLDIAAHTRTHPRLSKVSAQRAEREIVESMADLSDRLGQSPLPVLAYPDGDAPAAVEEIARRSGIELAFTTRRGMTRLDRCNYLRIGRINVGDATTPRLLRAQLVPWAAIPS